MLETMAIAEVATFPNEDIPILNILGNKLVYRPLLYFRIAVLKKDGKIRICGDYKVTINQALEIERMMIVSLVLPTKDPYFHKATIMMSTFWIFPSSSLIGQAEASPPSRTSNYIFQPFGVVYCNCPHFLLHALSQISHMRVQASKGSLAEGLSQCVQLLDSLSATPQQTKTCL